ncbi:MAG: hypothetical protein JW912_05960 [Sedimentisphaerales bacterium]|nr:hypothetical protein [Sedimentisphaerales bacterium]
MSKFTTIFVVLLVASVGVCFAELSDPVVFEDPAFKAVVETQLGIVDPTEGDMLGLVTLIANLKGISDITGIQYAENLLRLELVHNQITDITELSSLTKLQYLRLDNPETGVYYEDKMNNISDISSLAGLTSLQLLCLSGNAELSDISYLSGLTNLYELQLYRTQISDISPLIGMTNLETLHLTENDLDCDAYNIYIPIIIENNPYLANMTYDEKPEYCDTVEIDALVDIHPDTLNMKSNGRYVTAFITLPDGYDVADIDPATIQITNISGDEITDFPIDDSFIPVVGDHDEDEILDLTVKFDRQALVLLIQIGDKTITIEGDTLSGDHFIGSDTIRVINRGK